MEGRKGNIKANELSENRTTDLASLASTAMPSARANSAAAASLGLKYFTPLKLCREVASLARSYTQLFKDLLKGLCTQANPEQIVRPLEWPLAAASRLAR